MDGITGVGKCVCFWPACCEVTHVLERLKERSATRMGKGLMLGDGWERKGEGKRRRRPGGGGGTELRGEKEGCDGRLRGLME